jgi:hypothetical protein
MAVSSIPCRVGRISVYVAGDDGSGLYYYEAISELRVYNLPYPPIFSDKRYASIIKGSDDDV